VPVVGELEEREEVRPSNRKGLPGHDDRTVIRGCSHR
jgi:hypothetical protein